VKLLALSLAALLSACATPSTDAVLAPNSNLLAQGIPPIPMSLVERVAKYTDFRGHSFVEWHPVKSEMLIAHRKAGDNTPQIYRLSQPMAAPEQLTEGSDPVTSATWEPREGRYVVFELSQGGDEADQLYRLDLPSRQTSLLTDPKEAHNIVGWIRSSSTLLYTAVPLDRTAQGGTRAVVNTTLWAIDPAQPESSQRKVAELPGPGWDGGGVSDDGKQVAFVRYRSANESQVWLVDTGNGQSKQVLPAANESLKATHFSGGFSKDGKRLYVVSDRASEFREAMVFDLSSSALTRVTGHIPWDVSAGAASDDGRWFAAQINADGRDELRLFDAATSKELSAPKVPSGAIGNNMQFHRATHQLAFSVNSVKGPNELFVFDPASGRCVQWTRAQALAGIVGPSNFVTFLTNTESYRRDLRRVEYGDERDPATRAWMEKMAPLNNAEKMRKPMFVVQGKNDPRVPYTESEQIVAKVRANGLPVWYLRGENEGHGFARKENADFQFYAMVKFVEERLK
jgi:dipeptidyl aminopeptidase/acylaminoacyl peptidase